MSDATKRRQVGRPTMDYLVLHLSVPASTGALYADLAALPNGRMRAARLKALAARCLELDAGRAPFVPIAPTSAPIAVALPSGSERADAVAESVAQPADNDPVYEGMFNAFFSQ